MKDNKYINTEIVELGLVKGRHEMPVKDYIFDGINDVLDVTKLAAEVALYLGTHDFVRVEISEKTGEKTFCSNKAIKLYVTGLTTALVVVINECIFYGIPLRLMHYNKDTDEYVHQDIIVPYGIEYVMSFPED